MKITSTQQPTPKGVVDWFRLENKNGASVVLSTLGAGIIKVEVPDREGKIENICLAYPVAADYIADGPCAGKIPGRYANRIGEGHLEIDGEVHQLAINNGPNALHGGPEGFQNQIWTAEVIEDGVKFTYVAKDGEENYPGELTVTATYHWSDDNVLTLDMHAETDKPTVVNLTNHAYWNLRGADAGSILDHEMRMKAAHWLPTSDSLVPTGEILSVEGTPMDFREWKEIGKDIKQDFQALVYGKGYDNCWIFPEWKEGDMIEESVEIRCKASGRTLKMSSNQPAFQVYSGNWLAGSPKNFAGRSYEDYDGVALEMQGCPDAPNKPNFPSQMLRPGESYDRQIRFDFGIEA